MSYQKSDNGGSYAPINGESKAGPSKLWIVGAVVIVVATILGYSVTNKPGAATSAAVAKADLPMNKNGKLKLFDEHSKSKIITRFVRRSFHREQNLSGYVVSWSNGLISHTPSCLQSGSFSRITMLAATLHPFFPASLDTLESRFGLFMSTVVKRFLRLERNPRTIPCLSSMPPTRLTK